MKQNRWPFLNLVLALFFTAGCTGSDRMMLIEHNQESLDTNLSKNDTKLAQLERDRTQMGARLEELGQRLSTLESNMDQQKVTQQRIDKRLDQIEVAVRDNLKTSQAQMQESLNQDFADAKTQSEGDLQTLKAEVQRLGDNQKALLADINKRLDAAKKDLERFDREINKVYTEVPKMLQKATGASPGAGSATRSAPAGEGKTYTVQPGDTITKIARDHGVTPEKLRDANGMKSDVVRVGQELIIP